MDRQNPWVWMSRVTVALSAYGLYTVGRWKALAFGLALLIASSYDSYRAGRKDGDGGSS